MGEDYQYILATHIDKDHIHNHIILNNTNCNTHRTFETEFNQGKKSERAWAKVRELSDEVCKKYSLSVIDEPEKSKAVSHYERDMQKEGLSWKEKLRRKIADILYQSVDLTDFFKRCTESGIEYVYKPTNKYKLKFRMRGQERFTRAETLGEGFTVERIVEQIGIIQNIKTSKQHIAEISKPKTPEVRPQEPVAAPPNPQAEYISDFKKSLLAKMRERGMTPKPSTVSESVEVLSEKKNIEVDLWADIRGMRGADEIIAELQSAGVTSFDMLRKFFWNVHHDDDHTDELALLKKEINAIDTIIAKMKHLAEIDPIYQEYKSKSGWSQKRFKKKNASVIDDYEKTTAYIKENYKPYYVDGKPPTMRDLKDRVKTLKSEYNAISVEHKAFLTRKTAAQKYTKQVKKYLDEQRMKREREKNQQRIQSQKRNKYTLE